MKGTPSRESRAPLPAVEEEEEGGAGEDVA